MGDYEGTLDVLRNYLESVGISIEIPEGEDAEAEIVAIIEDYALSKTTKVPYPAKSDMEKENDEDMALMPRINALTEALDFCGAEEVQDFYEGIPYVLVVDDVTAFICSFEEISDNEYLLHFRADIPVDDMDPDKVKEKAAAFNADHVFARCYPDQEDLGIFEDDPGSVVTFHAVIPDHGEIKDSDYYGFFAGAFPGRYHGFLMYGYVPDL